MKIQVEAGVVVRLDRRTNTSVHGGVYDISTLSKRDRERVLSHEGVTELEGGAPEPKDPEAVLLDATVPDLTAALAEVTDPDVIRRAMQADSRSTATEHYEARLAELEGAAEASTENTDQE